jgi:UDP-GlcNAc:undecaprenyl-phosphate GlcNAc-1-phosphate transferase
MVIAWYRGRGWIDDPQIKPHPKKVHTKPVPRGGGLVVAGSVLVSMGLFLGADKHTMGIGLGILLLAAMGWWDDRFDMNPYLRLGLGLLAALAVVGAGIGIAYITNPWGVGVIDLSEPQVKFWLFGNLRTIWIWADLLALFWIVWCMNMLNWSKGLDGQLPGVVVIAAIVVGILSMRFAEDVTQWPVVILAGITAGAYLGFLPWNFWPQKMMPGYGGGTIAGFLLAVLSILSGAKLATLILVLGIPMIDAVWVMVRRVARGRSPVWGDRRHLHHRLLDLGWSKPRIAVFYWLMTLILGLVALQLNPRQKVFTILVIGLTFGAVWLWVRYYITFSRQRGRGSG